MKIAIVGAGGVGAYLGAVCARAGHPVALIARGAHAEALAHDGITVHSPSGTWQARPAMVTDDPATVGVADVVIVTVKNYHLRDVLAGVHTMIGARTVVLTLQNGVQAYDHVAAAVGAAQTLPGMIFCELSVESPGVVRSGIEPVRLTFGGIPPHPLHPTARALQHALVEAGVEVTLLADGRTGVWSKAVFVAAMSATTTISGADMGHLSADPGAQYLLEAALAEAKVVAAAEGIVFERDPVAAALTTARAMPTTARSSMSRDFAAGRPLEIDALSGEIVARGRALGIATPVNQALYALLRLRVALRDEEMRNR
jgi:2-dehydropantoate 2-reductase